MDQLGANLLKKSTLTKEVGIEQLNGFVISNLIFKTSCAQHNLIGKFMLSLHLTKVFASYKNLFKRTPFSCFKLGDEKKRVKKDYFATTYNTFRTF